MKRTLVVSALSFLVTLAWASIAFAADGKANAGSGFGIGAAAMLAAGLGLGLAAFGGALGQGRVGAAALEGIARNPGAAGKIFNPMIIALALIESLVIYAFVVSLILSFKF